MYEIRYSKPAERFLKKIRDKQLLAAFKAAIDELKESVHLVVIILAGTRENSYEELKRLIK